MVEEYAKKLRLKHDPFIKSLQQPPQQYTSNYEQMKARRSVYESDQAIHPSLLRERHREKLISGKMWTRDEDELLVKKVIENLTGVTVNRIPAVFLAEANHHATVDNDDQVLLSKLPDTIAQTSIEWDIISTSFPYRDTTDCRSRFRELIQPYQRMEFDEDEQRYVDHWNHDQVQRLKIGMIRYGWMNGNQQVIEWEKLSLYVGKSALQCRRKIVQFQETGIVTI